MSTDKHERSEVSRELPELSKQLGYALVRVLQDDYEPIIEMARTLRITFPSGEPCVEALAHSRAQDSGGEAVYQSMSTAPNIVDGEEFPDDGRLWMDVSKADYDRLLHHQEIRSRILYTAAEQGDLKIDNPKGSPAKGDVPLCEKYGDGCNFPDCPCDVDDPLTQQPFKGECFADALDEDIQEARTPHPSDAQQASRASNPSDAVCDCGSNVDNRQPHHDECAIYATPPTAQRQAPSVDAAAVLRAYMIRLTGCVDFTPNTEAIEAMTYALAAHGTNCQSAKADGGAVAPAAVEAVAWCLVDKSGFHVYTSDRKWAESWAQNPGYTATPLYLHPAQQRSEQVAVSAAVVARALVECPISLVAESRWEWIAKYINTALSKQVAGGGGVDSLPAELPNDIVQSLRLLQSPKAIRELWAALRPLLAALSTQPLLSDQPAGVRVDDAAISRALAEFQRLEGHAHDHNRMRAAVAALHPEQAKDGAAG